MCDKQSEINLARFIVCHMCDFREILPLEKSLHHQYPTDFDPLLFSLKVKFKPHLSSTMNALLISCNILLQ